MQYEIQNSEFVFKIHRLTILEHHVGAVQEKLP